MSAPSIRPASADAGGARAATVEFEHVTKRYERGTRGAGAVNDLSLAVPAGAICVLVGPSGCGKTTSLKMVNRLIEPTAGRVLIDGRDVASVDTTRLRRGIGYVIQQTGLFPHFTIARNVAVVPALLGWERARRERRVDELLELVGLDPGRHRHRYPAELSGGERQRVGVARALAADPPLMLMDEPFGAVDPIVRERLQNEFLRLQRTLAKTILFVTHDIDEAIKLGDLVAVMEVGGRLAQFDTPDRILAAPASDFVARFVGADRGLKRLSLARVSDLPLQPVPTLAEGAAVHALQDDAPYVLLVDADGRPLGWVDRRTVDPGTPLTAAYVGSTSPLLEPETTLKDALSMLLASAVQTGVVVDAQGRVVGQLRLDAIAGALGDGGPAAAPSRPD